MSPKKTKRSQAAQQLIDDLLEELPPSKTPSIAQAPKADPNAFEIAMSEITGSFGPVEKDKSDLPIFDGEGSLGNLKLESSQKVVLDPVQAAQAKARAEAQAQTQAAPSEVATRIMKREKPPFAGDAPVVTQMVQRSRIVRPPEDEIIHEDRQRPEADIDFGEMSAEDPFEVKPGAIQNAPMPSMQPQAQPQVEAQAQAAKSSPAEASSPAPAQDDERTMRVVQANTLVSQPEPRPRIDVAQLERDRERERELKTSTERNSMASIDRGGATEIRPGVKIPPSPRFASVGSSNAPTTFEGALKQSESLRIAQNRITDLERELERVRRDNEALSTAGDTLRRRSDELASKAESFEIQAREAALRLDEEKKVLRGQLQAKDRDNAEMRARVDEIEARLESNFKKIRVRERELEHRLEIVKMESATLVSTKDKMLLDLKRQIDQLHQESDSAKLKSQEMFSQYKEKQETIRRVVRALRIALTILEGDNETVVPIKKAE